MLCNNFIPKYQQIASNTCQQNTRKASSTCIFDEKPQIKSIPGIPLQEKYRWRVTLGHQVLGDKLSLEQAAELAGLKVKGVKS
ncbi:MAG: hypothetical protein F6J86_14605 [Symploca sp. SIO1B1]|nr:hypothetical protein [Symploca sp. SIO1B1]